MNDDSLPSQADQSVPTKPKDVMTIDELSEYLQVSKSTLYKRAQDGTLPAQKIGKHRRFYKQSINDWMREGDRNRAESSP